MFISHEGFVNVTFYRLIAKALLISIQRTLCEEIFIFILQKLFYFEMDSII